jgi:tetratricopeptide (TPR) repeat protein
MAEWGPPVARANDPRANELWKMALTEQRTAEGYLGRHRYGYALRFAIAAREHGKAAVAAIRGRFGVERVRKELDRTDALIEKAQARVRTGAAKRATDVLNKALELQRQARQSLAANRPLATLKLTLAARELLLRAWESAREEIAADLVEQALAENDALVATWSDDIKADGTAPSADLLEQGIKHQEAARGLFKQEKLQPALTECHTARRLLMRAVEMVKTEDAPSEPR